MASKEARLILHLVDGVSRPATGILGALKRVGGAVTGFSAHNKQVETVRGRLRRANADVAALSTAASYGVFRVGETLLENEQQLNDAYAAGNLTLARTIGSA